MDEQKLHSRFTRYRLHGEWFEPCEELMALIDKLNRGGPEIQCLTGCAIGQALRYEDMAERIGNIYPGEVLREDFLVPLGLTPYALAKGIGLTPIAISEILNGKRRITAATALRLARFFNTSARLWLNLQAAYDLEEEENRLAEQLAAIRPCEQVAA